MFFFVKVLTKLEILIQFIIESHLTVTFSTKFYSIVKIHVIQRLITTNKRVKKKIFSNNFTIKYRTIG
jgi:hypothetical protein